LPGIHENVPGRLQQVKAEVRRESPPSWGLADLAADSTRRHGEGELVTSQQSGGCSRKRIVDGPAPRLETVAIRIFDFLVEFGGKRGEYS
jgi:hypothetical protein